MHRVCAAILIVVTLLLAWPLAPAAHAATALPLAVRVTDAGIVTVADADLVAAGWALPIPRDRVTLSQRGAVLPLTDMGSGFAFVGMPSESRWSRTAVYWLSVGDAAAPRSALPSALPTPLTWEPDSLYDRHHATARGDGWWAGELRGTQTLSTVLDLPHAIPADTPVQVRLRATSSDRPHAVSLARDGQPLGTLRWDGSANITGTLALPAHAAGSMQLDLALASGGDTILVDAIQLPTVFPLATPVAVPPLAAVVAVPPDAAGADLLLITHRAFSSALAPLVAAHATRNQRAVIVDVQAAYDAWSGGARDPEAIRQMIRQARPGAVLLVGAGTVALRQASPPRPTFLPPYLLANGTDGETACDSCYGRLHDGPPAEQVVPDIPVGRFPVTTLAEAATLVAKTVTHLTAPPAGAWQGRALVLADNDMEADGTPDPAGDFTATAEVGLAALPRGMQPTRLYYAPNQPAPTGPFEPDTARLRCRMFRALDGGRASDTACAPVDATQSGVALWIYVGHGSPWQWATTTPSAPTPYLWYLYDADSRRNGDRLPILFAMTCLSGDVANPVLQSNDERLLLKAGGGIVASVSSAGEGVNTGHAALLAGALGQLYAPAGDRTLGAAHLAGLHALAARTPELAFAFAILGDPLVTAPFVPVASLALPLVQR